MATGAVGGCGPVVFELAQRLLRVGGGSPEFAGTPEVGGAFLRGAAGLIGADQAVLRCLGRKICEVCRVGAWGHAGADGHPVFSVGSGR